MWHTYLANGSAWFRLLVDCLRWRAAFVLFIRDFVGVSCGDCGCCGDWLGRDLQPLPFGLELNSCDRRISARAAFARASDAFDPFNLFSVNLDDESLRMNFVSVSSQISFSFF